MKEGRKKCAIVVDDHEDQRLFSRCVLEENGWEVMEASDGSEALALAKKNRPDLILSDVMMPSMDGFALCNALRANEEFDQTVFIFLTATFRDPKDEQTGYALGADGYIRQPVEPEYLHSRVQELVQKGRASRPNPELATGDQPSLSLYAKTMVRKLENKLQELSKAQDELRQVKTERENFFNMGLDLQCVATTDGRFLDVNESWTRTLGFTREELLNNPYTDFIHPDDLKATAEVVRELQDGANVFSFRNRYRTRDGQWRWLEWRTSVGQEKVIYATARDVTDQYRLNHEKQLLYLAMQVVPIALVLTDIHGDIQMVNAAFESMTGWCRDDVLGKKTTILKSGEHPESFYRQMWKTILAGEIWKGELINLRRDGSTYTERMVITPVRSADGHCIEYFVALKEDITGLKEEERLRQRSQRMESIGQMTGGIAHDLNNILTPIMMTVDLLSEDLSPQDYQKIAAMLKKNCDRAKKIISQLLTFSRGEEHESKVLNFRHMIKELSSLIHETFPPSIKVKLDIPSNTWLTKGDATQLHQVLLNLAVNARDAMPDGGELTFEVKNVQLDSSLQYLNQNISSGNYIHLTVTDTGTGIHPELIEKVFDPFFTTKDQGKGTGLGLSTALGIVRSHGGLIIPESKAGQGSAFTIYLPAVLESSSDRLPEGDGTVLLDLPHGQGETILIVDDEEAILEVLSSILSKFGYQVIAAPNAVEALVLFVQNQSSIAGVISDLIMPNMDGVALAEALQKVNPDVKIIGSTGSSGLTNERKFQTLRTLGVTTILKKPYSTQELVRTVAAEFFERY